MSKGTIIYVGQFEMPDKNAAAHRVVNNGKIFSLLGYRVVFLGTVREEKFDGIRKSANLNDVFEESYPTSFKKWLSHVFSISHIKDVVAQYEDVKIIVMYNTPYEKYRAVKKLVKNSGISVVYDCTEWNSYASGSLFKRFYKKIDEFEVRNFLGKKNDNLIVISSCMEHKYKNSNLLKLPPLIDTCEPVWHQSRTLNTDVFEFCFAGTANNKERLDIIINAFAKIDNSKIRLRIIGLTKDDYIKEYNINSDTIDNRIIFMGRTTHEESVRYTLSSDCYIFIREPSIRNMAGFPTKFAEAFTCGVPIISTNVSDIGKYASSEDRVIILETASIQSVADAINNIIKNKDNYRRKEVDNTFDYKNYVSDTELWMNKI